MKFLLPTSVILGLYSAFVAGAILLRLHPTQRPSQMPASRVPVATLLLAFAIALTTTLQFFFPQILATLQRDAAHFANGDWWRIVTALFVQDGGLAGTIFNLASLLLVGGIAEKLWGSRLMLVIFFVGGIAAEIVALAWQPIGAGNSVGNFSLAASVAGACLIQRPGWLVQLAAFVALIAYCVLVVLGDIHGAAATVGILLAIVFRKGWQPRGPEVGIA